MKILCGVSIALFFCLLGCTRHPRRPANVPASAVWVDGVFIHCSVEKALLANRCTIYKDAAVEVLESGLFRLTGAGREASPEELQYAAFDGARIFLQDARQLVPFLLEEYATPALEERLRVLAGSGAINCGRVWGTQNPKASSDCALLSFQNKKPFYVQFDFEGLASDATGPLYGLEYHSWGWSPEKLPKSVELSDGNRLLTAPCPKPVILSKTYDGKLTCAKPIA
jgi:hypothetical protein